MTNNTTKSKNEKSTWTPKLVLNTYIGKNIEGEAFITDHIFSYILHGKHDVWVGGKKYSFQEGDFRFFKRNQLSKYVKNTDNGGFKSIAVHIDQTTLKEMSKQYSLFAEETYSEGEAFFIQPDHKLKGFVESLTHYLQEPKVDERIVLLKTQELVFLLLENNPSFKNILFDFAEPGKIDLEAFMNSHYRYNVSIERFAFLTGRSLSGFKRDFEKLFNTSPSRWLIRNRLEDAKYQIENKKEKPSEVYLELGFEDLSHFSYAYKKAFGYAPNKRI
ncbi:helix-turn-helix domain-containing protein [Chryseobacterium taiwanense]|uniref:helix-turn-helix domain-containing protein n=1 Tax=Chryseobacterium taiwanense TaxID=363331 RepID=UPI000690B741|nr:AraC family transcriptional regulator [Chryseobacterium taiwanense]